MADKQICEDCGQEEGHWSFNFYLCDKCRAAEEKRQADECQQLEKEQQKAGYHPESLSDPRD